MIQPNSCLEPMPTTHPEKIACQGKNPCSRSTQNTHASGLRGKSLAPIPSMSSNSTPSVTKPLSKPFTGRITHTRIPSLTKGSVVQKAPQTLGATLKSRTTSLGHARTASVPTSTTSTTHTRIGSVTSNTSRLRSTNLLSQTKGIPKSSIRVASRTGRKPGVASQQFHVPDDTVLSLLGDSEKELLGGEYLFQV